MTENKKNNIWYILGGIIIFGLLIAIIVIQIQNKQEQEEIQRELQRQQEEKEFCDSLKISIEPFDLVATTGMGLGNVGVNYKFCSNKDTIAKSIITLKNGRVIENEENLGSNTCFVQQLSSVPGDENEPYISNINCKDVKSIELISTRCPNVKEIITDMSKITCGI